MPHRLYLSYFLPFTIKSHPYYSSSCIVFGSILHDFILSTKKHSHNLKVESSFIWWECLGLWAPGRQHLSSSDETAPRRKEGKAGYVQVCNKRSRCSNTKDQLSTKEFTILCVGRSKPLGSLKFIPFTCTSAISGQSWFLVHLASCIPPAPQQSPWRGWQHLLNHSLGSPQAHLEARIDNGCDISCLLMW